jgi:hypothetical protein
MQTAQKSTAKHGRVGPYSRTLNRGVIGATVDGRSTLGRLMRTLEAELVAHVGGKPTVTQRMLIDRAVKIRVQLDLLDEKVARGDWTGHDTRTYGGLHNAYRLTVRELGMRPAAEKPMDALTYLAAKRAADAAA